MGKDWDDLSAVVQSKRGTQRKWKRPEWEASKAPKFQNNAPAFDLSSDSNQKMQAWHLQWLKESYRVLRSGGVIKAFCGTRTFHRMAAAMVEVGLIDLRLEAWAYGSGFPKSLNVGKAIDKVGGKHGDTLREFCNYVNETRLALGLSMREIDEALGLKSGGASSNHWTTHPTQPRFPREALYFQLKTLLDLDSRFDEAIKEHEREVIGIKEGFKAGSGVAYGGSGGWSSDRVEVTVPASDAAHQWKGWGTALKPSWEPVLVGRKPE